MIRNLKALGLALCAVFAFSALSASSASAVNDVITSPQNDTFVTGTQIGGKGLSNVFGTKWEPNATVTCGKGTYTGTFTGTAATEVEVTPKYEECEASGGFSATVDEEGCKFVLTGTTDAFIDTAGKANGEDATVKLNCSHTGRIRITLPFFCTITFSDTSGANTVNQNLLGVKYDNEKEAASGKWDVKATVTVDKIHYTSANCGFLGITGTDNDGFLTTNVTVKGYSNSTHTTQTDLTVS
jgi:hypothetical protein